jgi:polyhydroxyalkanoate synthesis regulator protein
VKPEERTQLIQAILEQNRLFALAAERANEPQLARVLRAFTPILENLASERREADASDLAQLNFELRVMQARLKAEAESQSTAQSIAL